MRGHITTSTSGRKRQTLRRALGLGLGMCALVIPSTATAFTMDPPLTVNAVASGSDDSSQPSGDPSYSSVNSITAPASEPSGSGGPADVASGYSSLTAITGAPASEPTLASSSPTGAGEGFDWASAAVGAGAAMTLVAFGGAALFTVRRRAAISPSASTG